MPRAVFAVTDAPPEEGVSEIAGIGAPPPEGAESVFNRIFMCLNVITENRLFYVAAVA